MIAITLSILAFLASLLALHIACKQLLTARRELLHRRRKVYNTIRSFLLKCSVEEELSDAQVVDFIDRTADADFLFDEPVAKMIKDILERASKMREHRKVYLTLPAGEERVRLQAAERAEKDRFLSQIDYNKVVFSAYLQTHASEL